MYIAKNKTWENFHTCSYRDNATSSTVECFRNGSYTTFGTAGSTTATEVIVIPSHACVMLVWCACCGQSHAELLPSCMLSSRPCRLACLTHFSVCASDLPVGMIMLTSKPSMHADGRTASYMLLYVWRICLY